ncbi:MAG: cupin domain-containing protein [Betaproteobacteria bacterium]|jgi:gentisate 1,2-dioxygenase
MTATAIRAAVEQEPPYAGRARYLINENGFAFSWPAVPIHQFLAERDRAFDAATPSGLIALDIGAALSTSYPATTPTLLCRYVKIRAGEQVRAAFAASGEIYYVMSGSGTSRNGNDVIDWASGDVFCFPGGGESTHRAANIDSLLFCVTNEPLLAFERLRAPLPGHAVVETTYWPAAEIERQFQAVWSRPVSANTTGNSVQFSTTALAPSSNTIPTINTAINTLEPGCDQRPHRHNGAAVTLAIQGEGIHSLIDGKRVDWSTGAAQITPATMLHSHHSRGPQRMRSFVIQDEGLHHYTRTPGFSFE